MNAPVKRQRAIDCGSFPFPKKRHLTARLNDDHDKLNYTVHRKYQSYHGKLIEFRPYQNYEALSLICTRYEPQRGKTNVVDSDQNQAVQSLQLAIGLECLI